MSNKDKRSISSFTNDSFNISSFGQENVDCSPYRNKMHTISKRLKRIDQEEPTKRFVGTRSCEMNMHLRIRTNKFYDSACNETFISQPDDSICKQNEKKTNNRIVEKKCVVSTEQKEEEKKESLSFPKPSVDLIELQNDEHYFSYYLNKIVLKYLVIAFTFTISLAGNLNRSPFGFARITFSQGSWLILRIVFFGTLVDLFSCWLMSKFKVDKFDKLFLIESSIVKIESVLFILANCLIYFSLTLGIVGLVLAVAISIWIHSTVYKDVEEFSSNQGLMYSILRYALLILFTLVLVHWFGNDMLRIVYSFI